MCRECKKSICGADCENCGFEKNNGCPGCAATNGRPFGRGCFVAEYIALGGMKAYREFTENLIDEINSFTRDIAGMPQIKELYPMNGEFLNLAYPLPGGNEVRFLDDREIYLAAQTECEFSDGAVPRCFGVVANPAFILVAEYGENGADPVLLAYKTR